MHKSFQSVWAKLPDYLCHHTVTSGHSRLSARAEVGGDLGLGAHVHGLSVGVSRIPCFRGYSARGCIYGTTLAVEVLRNRRVISRFIATPENTEESKQVFSILLEKDISKAGADEPTAPYCSTSLTLDGPAYAHDLLWVADYQRCIAWTWFAWLKATKR